MRRGQRLLRFCQTIAYGDDVLNSSGASAGNEVDVSVAAGGEVRVGVDKLAQALGGHGRGAWLLLRHGCECSLARRLIGEAVNADVPRSDRHSTLGWALYHPYRDPRIWQGCYETTIYLSPNAQGQGVGTALMRELVDRARADDKVHSLLALIVSTNTASLKLHEKFGFENVGTLKEVTYKFDHWLSLTHLELLV